MFHYRIKLLKRSCKRISAKLQYLLLNNRSNSITTYWYDRVTNFGDLLTPFLLRKYGMLPLYSEKNKADVLCIGSILNSLSEEYTGYILGSGLIRDEVRDLHNAKILAVRGELTRKRISAPPSITLGDPGLLADRLLSKRQAKKFTLGIVPHYVDKQDARIQKIFQKYKHEILIIDVQKNPKAVVENIDRCRYILSSSLHGIVVADSLGIANGWVHLSDNVAGNGFKFHDYASAFSMEIEQHDLIGTENLDQLIEMTHPVSSMVEKVKEDLDSAFRTFLDAFKNQPKGTGV